MINRIILDVLMTDGTEYRDLVVTMADRNKFGQVARRRKWPSMSDDYNLFMTFVAWHALRREGRTNLDYEAFEATCETVDSAGDDAGEGVEEVEPFRE